MQETIFSKIINKEIPADIIYQDEQVTVFRDIHPQAPVHLLIVPNQVIATLNEVTADQTLLLGHMMQTAIRLAKQLGIAESGYRLIMNCNADAGQEVYHLHLHLVGGKNLGKMLADN